MPITLFNYCIWKATLVADSGLLHTSVCMDLLVASIKKSKCMQKNQMEYGYILRDCVTFISEISKWESANYYA